MPSEVSGKLCGKVSRKGSYGLVAVESINQGWDPNPRGVATKNGNEFAKNNLSDFCSFVGLPGMSRLDSLNN